MAAKFEINLKQLADAILQLSASQLKELEQLLNRQECAEKAAGVISKRSLTEKRKQLRLWLAKQRSSAAIRSYKLNPHFMYELDAELDQLLAQIRDTTRGISEKQIAEDVEEAVRAVKAD